MCTVRTYVYDILVSLFIKSELMMIIIDDMSDLCDWIDSHVPCHIYFSLLNKMEIEFMVGGHNRVLECNGFFLGET